MSGPILVGYLDSPEGRAAVDAAIAQARLTGARLIIITSHRGGGGMTTPDALDIEDDLADVRAHLADKDVAYDVRALVRGNDVAEDLVDLAKETDAAMIVIGLRKRNPVGKLILGSNSQQILLDAPCPVLAVKA